MTNAEKKERNRAYYLKNRERILGKARVRNASREKGRLSVVSDGRCSADEQSYQHFISDGAEKRRLEIPVEADNVQQSLSGHDCGFSIDYSTNFQIGDFQMKKDTNVIWLLPGESHPFRFDVQSTEALSSPMVTSENFSIFRHIRKSPSFIFRLLLVAGLTVLMTAMQVAFYREHDILPGFAVPLAIAGELAFISLVTMKLSKHLEWIRVVIFLTFFGYFVSSLSFHVFANTRSEAALSSSTGAKSASRTELESQLKEARDSLKLAKQGRSWKNMEQFGAEVSKLEGIIRDLPNARVLGTSLDDVLGIQVILLVLLRALLMAAEGLNAVRLRDQWAELAGCNRPVMSEV